MQHALAGAGLAALVLCGLAGCGGDGNAAADLGTAMPRADTQLEAGAPAPAAAAAGPQAPVRMKAPALPEALQRAAADLPADDGADVRLSLLRPDGLQAASLELAPVRGVGYASVRARIAGIRTNSDVPAASRRAECASDSECSFRLPLADGTQRLYVLRIAQDAAARLVPGESEGEVLVVARQVAMPARTAVELTLVSGRHESSARVAYLGADAVQAAVAEPVPASDAAPGTTASGMPASWLSSEPPSRRHPFGPRS